MDLEAFDHDLEVGNDNDLKVSNDNDHDLEVGNDNDLANNPKTLHDHDLDLEVSNDNDHDVEVGNDNDLVNNPKTLHDLEVGNDNDLVNNPRRDEVIEDQLNLTSPCHAVLKYLIPSLFGAAAVKCQAKSEDPFETHPLQTWSFVAAILSYSLLFLAVKQLQNRRHNCVDILNGVTFASGVLSSFSLLSLLLPCYPGLVFLEASWALSAAIAAWPLLNGLISHARSLLTAWKLSQQESVMPV